MTTATTSIILIPTYPLLSYYILLYYPILSYPILSYPILSYSIILSYPVHRPLFFSLSLPSYFLSTSFSRHTHTHMHTTSPSCSTLLPVPHHLTLPHPTLHYPTLHHTPTQDALGPLSDPHTAIDRTDLPSYHRRIRRFHPDELLAISGFPCTFIWPKNSKINLEKCSGVVGNSINVSVVRCVMQVLFGIPSPRSLSTSTSDD